MAPTLSQYWFMGLSSLENAPCGVEMPILGSVRTQVSPVDIRGWMLPAS